jgi:signal transduction histidine kinase
VNSRLERARQWIRSHPTAADTALAAALSAAALVSSHVEIDNLPPDGPLHRSPSTVAIIAGVLLVVGPLALRRRLPLTTLIACTAGFLVARIVLDSSDASITAIALSLAVYSAAAHGQARRRNWVCGVSLVAVMGELWRELYVIPMDGLKHVLIFQMLTLLVNLALFCAMWALGAALGTSRRRGRELTERNAQLEHTREENARRAVFDERVRIARELHDVVAHHVSVMGVQAGAARVVMARDPAKATDALASIESSSRQAVTELHRLLGFLRQEGDPDDLAPSPGLGEVVGLAATMSESDLSVDVEFEGERRPLPPTVDISAYRIVQEALTNALKHSGASRAGVRVSYGRDQIELEITDNGRGTSANGNGTGTSNGGLGLIGMRERAALHGGELTAGPVPSGGFAVRATLPTPERAR